MHPPIAENSDRPVGSALDDGFGDAAVAISSGDGEPALDIEIWSLGGGRLASLEIPPTGNVRQIKDAIKEACDIPIFTQQLVHPVLGILPNTLVVRALPEPRELQLARLAFDEQAGARMIEPVQRGDVAVVERLLHGQADPNRGREEDAATPLMMASQHGHLEVAMLLVEARADVSRCKVKNATALMIAASRDKLELVRFLAEARADLDQRMAHGETAFLFAAQNGHADIARLLWEAGADVHTPKLDGACPLLMASQNGHAAVVRLLLRFRADANRALPADGCTPLIAAVRFARTHGREICEELLAHGADRTARVAGNTVIGTDGTALDVAREHEQTHLFDIL